MRKLRLTEVKCGASFQTQMFMTPVFLVTTIAYYMSYHVLYVPSWYLSFTASNSFFSLKELTFLPYFFVTTV